MNSEPRPCLIDVGFPLSGSQDSTSTSDLKRHAQHTAYGSLRSRADTQARSITPTTHKRPDRPFAARAVASTGADFAAVMSAAASALSGPLHGGAPSRVLKMLDEVEQAGNAEKWASDSLDRGERLMDLGHRVYRAEDPRARVLRRTCRELGSPTPSSRSTRECSPRRAPRLPPDRVLATNVEFWSAVVSTSPKSHPTSSHRCSAAHA